MSGVLPNPRRDRMCEMYRRGVPVLEIADAMGVQRPAVWKALRAGGVLPPYSLQVAGGNGRPRGGGAEGYSTARRERSLAASFVDFSLGVHVYREPCPYCGVRADIGCSHRAADNSGRED